MKGENMLTWSVVLDELQLSSEQIANLKAGLSLYSCRRTVRRRVFSKSTKNILILLVFKSPKNGWNPPNQAKRFILTTVMLCTAIKCSANPPHERMVVSRDFANFNDGRGLTYTCKDGFSFNPVNINDTSRTVHCQSNGSFEQLSPSGCKRKW